MKVKHTSSTFRHTRKQKEPEPTAAKPDRRKLKGIYRNLASATDEVRIDGLGKALQWYDEAWEWLQQDKKKRPLLDLLSFKAVDDANTLRMRAHEHVDDSAMHEHLLRDAIEQYELAVKKVLPTKPVAEIYDARKKKADRLAKRSEKLSRIYSRTLDEMFAAFKPKNGRGESMTYKVCDAPPVEGKEHRPRWISKDMRTLQYTQEHAKWMCHTVRSEGWLGVLNEEVGTLGWLSLSTYDPDSEQVKVVNPKIHDAIKRLMENVRRYAVANPKFALRLVKGRRKKKVLAKGVVA